ncbi:MAG: choice-of-anchor D domain-containing protein [Candidatus Binatus sp.]
MRCAFYVEKLWLASPLLIVLTLLLAAAPARAQQATLSGTVQSGGLSPVPVSGASVTLYAVGTNYGSNPTSLGSATTDSSGNFTVQYTRPDPGGFVVYLVALGGNAGSGINTAIGLMGLDLIPSLTPTSLQNGRDDFSSGDTPAAQAPVTINELTTVAAETALAQFSDSTGDVIGTPSGNATGFDNAVNQAEADLVNTSTGLPASFWPTSCTGGSPPVNCDGLERLDTIANILAACVESNGPQSSACSTLLSDTGSVGGTTLQAAHSMATYPVMNVGALFKIQGASPPFTPYLQAKPDGWEIALNFAPANARLDETFFLAIDAGGNVWVANFKGNSVTELNPSGDLIGTFAPNTAGFDGADDLAIDADGNVWVTNQLGNSVTELNSHGQLVNDFAPSGAKFNHPFNLAIDATGNVWVGNRDGNSVTELNSSGDLVGHFAPSAANFNLLEGVAIDADSNVWIGNTNDNSLVELNSSGKLVKRFTLSSANFQQPVDVAIDAVGDVWAANNSGNSVSELFAGCSASTCTGHSFAPKGSDFNSPAEVAIDAAGNIWVTNNSSSGSVTELDSGGGLMGNFAPSGAGFDVPTGIAIDAAGNVWVANGLGNSVAEIVGAARPVLTPLVACLTQTPAHAVCLAGGPASPSPTSTSTASATPTPTPSPGGTPTATPTPTSTATPVDAKLKISPASVKFKATAVNSVSKPKEVTIKNESSKSSGITVMIAGEMATPPFAVTGQCATSLAPGKSCKVSVTFGPTDTSEQHGQLTISDDEAGPPQTVQLSGTGKTAK